MVFYATFVNINYIRQGTAQLIMCKFVDVNTSCFKAFNDRTLRMKRGKTQVFKI